MVRLARRAGFSRAHRTAPMQAGHAKRYPDIAGVGIAWIEVKRWKHVNVEQAFKALEALRPALPIVAWRCDGKPGTVGRWRGALHLETLFNLLRGEKDEGTGTRVTGSARGSTEAPATRRQRVRKKANT